MRLIIATARSAAAAATVPASGTAGAASLAMAVTFCMRAIHRKTRSANGIVNEIDSGVAQVIDGDFIHHYLYAVRFKYCVDIADVVIQRHAEIYAATTAPSYVHAQGVSFEFSIRQNVPDGFARGRGECKETGINFLEHKVLLFTTNFGKCYQV